MEGLGTMRGKDRYHKPVVQTFNDYCRKCDSLIDRGLYDNAQKLARQAMTLFPDAIRPYEHLGLAVTLQGQDNQAEIAAWRACIDRFRDRARPNWFIKLQVALERGQEDVWQGSSPQRTNSELEALYAEAREIWPQSWESLAEDDAESARRRELSLTVGAWIAFGRANAAMKFEIDDQALKAWEVYFDAYPDRATLPAYFSYIVALDSCAPPDEERRSEALIKKALSLWPLDLLKQPAEDRQAQFERRQAAMLCLFIGRRLLSKNQIAEAKSLFARIPADLREAQVAEQLGQISESLTMLTAYQDLFGQEIDFSNRRSILPWRCPKPSRKVIFVFGGAQADNLNLAMSNIHLALRDRGCHLVYLADQNGSFYLTGGDWGDPEELCRKLKAVASFLGADQLYTLGNSSGGYAAIRYGVELQVQAILAFSPVTLPLTTAIGPSRLSLKKLQRSQRQLRINLDDFLAQNPALPRTRIAYGEDCTADRTAAQWLEEKDAVQVETAPGFTSHGALRWFIANDRFVPLLEELVGDTSLQGQALS
ncbi:hypothetical protein ACTL6U_21270 [Rhodovibrionaceae bacterium A322]